MPPNHPLCPTQRTNRRPLKLTMFRVCREGYSESGTAGRCWNSQQNSMASTSSLEPKFRHTPISHLRDASRPPSTANPVSLRQQVAWSRKTTSLSSPGLSDIPNSPSHFFPFASTATPDHATKYRVPDLPTRSTGMRWCSCDDDSGSDG